jgi:hypothetical protein
MNIEQLYRKLIESARSRPADDRVPYAFEGRVMARLKDLPKVDLATLWGRHLWRAAVPFACVALAITLWTRGHEPAPPAPVHAEAHLTALDEVLLAPIAELGLEEATW